MPPIAKVFITGNSQAIRLPKAFRVDVSEMWISKDEVSGEITLKPKDDDKRRRNLEKVFELLAKDPLPESFLSEESRQNAPPIAPAAHTVRRRSSVRSRK